MLIRGDARALPLADACVDCVVTSPPYFGLRDYGTATWNGGDAACNHVLDRTIGGRASTLGGGKANQVAASVYVDCPKCGAQRQDKQLGLEPSPDAYVAALVGVFREVRRVLKPEGTVWLNIGDSYAAGGDKTLGRRDESPVYLQRRFERYGTGRVKASTGLNAATSLAVTHDLKPKDLMMIPARVALALQADGWYLRSDIIWSKPNPMPESVTDRPTKAHEYLFLLTKAQKYFYDAAAIAEPGKDWSRHKPGSGIKPTHHYGAGNGGSEGLSALARRIASGDQAQVRNKRSVWTIPTLAYAGAHFATMPEALVEPCVLAGCPLGGLVLDPFIGSGTVGAVASRLGRRWVGVDLSYHDLARKRTAQRGIVFGPQLPEQASA